MKKKSSYSFQANTKNFAIKTQTKICNYCKKVFGGSNNDESACCSTLACKECQLLLSHKQIDCPFCTNKIQKEGKNNPNNVPINNSITDHFTNKEAKIKQSDLRISKIEKQPSNNNNDYMINPVDQKNKNSDFKSNLIQNKEISSLKEDIAKAVPSNKNATLNNMNKVLIVPKRGQSHVSGNEAIRATNPIKNSVIPKVHQSNEFPMENNQGKLTLEKKGDYTDIDERVKNMNRDKTNKKEEIEEKSESSKILYTKTSSKDQGIKNDNIIKSSHEDINKNKIKENTNIIDILNSRQQNLEYTNSEILKRILILENSLEHQNDRVQNQINQKILEESSKPKEPIEKLSQDMKELKSSLINYDSQKDYNGKIENIYELISKIQEKIALTNKKYIEEIAENKFQIFSEIVIKVQTQFNQNDQTIMQMNENIQKFQNQQNIFSNQLQNIEKQFLFEEKKNIQEKISLLNQTTKENSEKCQIIKNELNDVRINYKIENEQIKEKLMKEINTIKTDEKSSLNFEHKLSSLKNEFNSKLNSIIQDDTYAKKFELDNILKLLSNKVEKEQNIQQNEELKSSLINLIDEIKLQVNKNKEKISEFQLQARNNLKDMENYNFRQRLNEFELKFESTIKNLEKDKIDQKEKVKPDLQINYLSTINANDKMNFPQIQMEKEPETLNSENKVKKGLQMFDEKHQNSNIKEGKYYLEEDNNKNISKSILINSDISDQFSNSYFGNLPKPSANNRNCNSNEHEECKEKIINGEQINQKNENFNNISNNIQSPLKSAEEDALKKNYEENGKYLETSHQNYEALKAPIFYKKEDKFFEDEKKINNNIIKNPPEKDNDLCLFCNEPLENIIAILPCKHMYHKECEYTKDHKVCDKCKTEYTSNSIKFKRYEKHD